jgi:cell division transport system ATP-binding protein
MNTMIRFNNVSVQYPNGVRALSDLSLEIETGEFVFVIGHTGAGKSTFLKLLQAAAIPTSGTITLDDQDITALKRSQIPALRRRLGIIFQDYQLLPDRTIYENVAFALYVTGCHPRKIMPKVTNALELVGLLDRRESYPSHLSGGEQQRVCIARALVTEPLILLADEPTGNLDPETSLEIIDLLEDINTRGATVLIATHDKSVVDRLRKRVLAFENGRLVRDDKSAGYAPKAFTELGASNASAIHPAGSGD